MWVTPLMCCSACLPACLCVCLFVRSDLGQRGGHAPTAPLPLLPLPLPPCSVPQRACTAGADARGRVQRVRDGGSVSEAKERGCRCAAGRQGKAGACGCRGGVPAGRGGEERCRVAAFAQQPGFAEAAGSHVLHVPAHSAPFARAPRPLRSAVLEPAHRGDAGQGQPARLLPDDPRKEVRCHQVSRKGNSFHVRS